MSISSLIPHRPPMHWIDSATVAADGSATATRAITAEHPFLRDGAILPSALIEMLAQTSACASAARAKSRSQSIKQGLLVAIRELVFTAECPVGIGSVLTLTSIPERVFGSFTECRCVASLGTKPIVSARLTFRVEFG